MTRAFIAAMLGSRRAAVTETLNKLRAANLIEMRRSHLVLLDQTKLEKMSCEYYSVTRNWFNQLR